MRAGPTTAQDRCAAAEHPGMRVSSRPLRTLNSRMLLWLSLILLPLIGGGVVGLVLQQYCLHQMRTGANHTATEFLTLERTHQLLHDAEVAATARMLAPSNPEIAVRLRVADA